MYPACTGGEHFSCAFSDNWTSVVTFQVKQASVEHMAFYRLGSQNMDYLKSTWMQAEYQGLCNNIYGI
jgi:hypothetical protein